MGKVSGNWITGTHSGRACKHENIYTKVNRKTGACVSVKLCNPSDKVTVKQITARNGFSLVSAAVSKWINDNRASGASVNADYLKVMKAFDAQTKYATLRGFMMAKGMYTVSADPSTGSGQAVTVDITARTDFKTAFGIESAVGSEDDSQSGDASGNQNAGTPSTDSGSTGSPTGTTKYTLSLTASPTNGGSVSGAGQYNSGASTTISATPASGYTFTRWSDGDTSASRTLTVSANTTLSAIFTAVSGDDDPENAIP